MLRRSLSLLAFLLLPLSAVASSHRENPNAQFDNALDSTDVYLFRSPDAPDTVTMVANYYPFVAPAGGPNWAQFDPRGKYLIHVDNNGDAIEDITYEFTFKTAIQNQNTFLYATGPITSLDDPDYNIRQTYTLVRIDGPYATGARTTLLADAPVPPANIGPKSTPSYEQTAMQAVRNLPNGGKVFAGLRDDPFFVDLGAVFDLATLRPIQQLHKVPPVANADRGYDYVAKLNVLALVLQVPIAQLTRAGEPVIGMWTAALKPRVQIASAGSGVQSGVGGYVQVSRLGMPLVNEVVVPLALKNAFAGLHPRSDLDVFNSVDLLKNAVLDPELGKAVNALYGVSVPPAPRNDILEVFLTGVKGLNQPANVRPSEMLRLNTSTPITAASNVSRLGVLGGDLQGFPNGRRLADDVTDIELRVVAGVLLPDFNKSPNNAITDGVDANDAPFSGTFPYLAAPWSGFDTH
ncbi:MAG TPA: DUF4331 domain-containing protein [Thermoanaerobaculia bacterium]|nr:DUF4331 domain-containing protein [Thermoanaerobaculia bacterium]